MCEVEIFLKNVYTFPPCFVFFLSRLFRLWVTASVSDCALRKFLRGFFGNSAFELHPVIIFLLKG